MYVLFVVSFPFSLFCLVGSFHGQARRGVWFTPAAGKQGQHGVGGGPRSGAEDPEFHPPGASERKAKQENHENH